jgi:hypothetical protein
VRLILPSVKARHAGRYRGVLPRLLHDPATSRDRNAQAGIWDSGMRPPAGAMHPEVYLRGETMGLIDRRILRPDWSRDRRNIDMQVDHVIEFQVLPATEHGWADGFANYELLDQPSNGSAGPRLAANIQRERAALAAYYSDMSWLTRPLRFDVVVTEIGPGGERWLEDEIAMGQHLDSLEEHQGEH